MNAVNNLVSSAMGRKGLLLLVVIFLLFDEGEAIAQDLAVDEADENLLIEGTLTENATSFAGAVRLTYSGTEAAEIRLLASDLRASGVVLPRSSIAIPTGTTLAPGEPTDVVVTVSNVTRPGTYNGFLTFSVVGKSDSSVEVPIELQIHDQVEITGLEEAAIIRVTKCSLLCDLWSLLVPPTEVDDNSAFALKNETDERVIISNLSIILKGETSGDLVDTKSVDATIEELPKNEAVSVPVEVSSEVSPDSYVGFVRLISEVDGQSIDVPLELTVRSGPLIPLIVIILGILVGRLVRSQQAPRAEMQLSLYPSLSNLRMEANKRILNSVAAQHVDQKIDELMKRLDDSTETPEDLAKAALEISTKVAVLANLELLEQELRTSSIGNKTELQGLVGDARVEVLQDKIEEAKKKEVKVRDDLIRHAASGPLGTPLKAAGAGPTLVMESETPGRGLPQTPSLAERIAARISGIRIGAGTRYLIIRPALWLLLVFVLSMLGLQYLYLENHSFGANGFVNYLGLFLWGLTADVSSATLLTRPAKPQPL